MQKQCCRQYGSGSVQESDNFALWEAHSRALSASNRARGEGEGFPTFLFLLCNINSLSVCTISVRECRSPIVKSRSMHIKWLHLHYINRLTYLFICLYTYLSIPLSISLSFSPDFLATPSFSFLLCPSLPSSLFALSLFFYLSLCLCLSLTGMQVWLHRKAAVASESEVTSLQLDLLKERQRHLDSIQDVRKYHEKSLNIEGYARTIFSFELILHSLK